MNPDLITPILMIVQPILYLTKLTNREQYEPLYIEHSLYSIYIQSVCMSPDLITPILMIVQPILYLTKLTNREQYEPLYIEHSLYSIYIQSVCMSPDLITHILLTVQLILCLYSLYSSMEYLQFCYFRKLPNTFLIRILFTFVNKILQL